MKNLLLLFLSMSLFAACQNANETAVQTPPDQQTQTIPEPPAQPTEGIFAKIVTDKGDMLALLEHKRAPLTVANFVALAEGDMKNVFREEGEPFFDGLTFHRVVPGFVIQGGDHLGNGTGMPGYQFRQEVNPDILHNKAGTLSMARRNTPGTNGSQFFITLAATPQLDMQYNVFGYLVEGLPIIQQIQRNDTIRKIEIIRKGAEAEAFNAPQTFQELNSQ